MIDIFSSENLGLEGGATGEEVIMENWLVQDSYDFNTKVSKLTILTTKLIILRIQGCI